MTKLISQTDSGAADDAICAPRAAYVHIPFCRHRCGYCNFTLVAGRDDLIGDYLRAITIEVNTIAGCHEVDTLYFGGGTPTHLKPDEIHHLTNVVLARHPLAAGHEFTVEANPADIDHHMIATLAALGVTRISLGGQSFRTEKLRLLERDHLSDDIRRVIADAREANMHVSLDLIFATPGETLDAWSTDLESAISLAPDHVSTYGLTFERGTSFWSRRLHGALTEVDEELQRDMYALAIDKLATAGYEHYEVSNFARPGCRSRHNQVYWSGASYFAYGPGASRYINNVRETNHRSTTAYLDRVLCGRSPTAEREQLSKEGRARELLVFSLRRLAGISRELFRARTEFEIDELAAIPIRKFVDLGLLADNGEQICLTREGLFVSDAMWPEFL